jgi:hypothetical protein
VRALAFLLLLTSSARAQDSFEIQVYDAETAAPREFGMEAHVNAFEGSTEHLTLEPHLGMLPWLEVGAYLQTGIHSDGSFSFGGVKLRAKARLRRHRGFGFALNVELASVPQEWEAARVGIELRPIVDFKAGRLWVSINPIVGIGFFGPDAYWPELDPCIGVLYEITGPWSIGAEYYAAVPLHHAGENVVHRVFGIVQREGKKFGVHVGAGYGWPEGWIVKMILSVSAGE